MSKNTQLPLALRSPAAPGSWVLAGAPATPPAAGLSAPQELTEDGHSLNHSVHCGDVKRFCSLAANQPCPKQGMMLKSQTPLSSQALASVSRLGDDGHHAALHRALTLHPASPCQLQHSAGEERGRGKCPLQEGGDISVGKGHTEAKPSKHSPLLPASLSRVRKTSGESLQRADGTYLQHRQTRINVGRSRVN